MKIGMIFECGPDGADVKVCRHLVRMINNEVDVEHVTLDNKPNLIAKCGVASKTLIDKGCDCILIVWDLYPAWRESGQRPCRKEDRAAILKSLEKSDVSLTSIYLICIQEELEAWLLADGRALSTVLSRPTHQVSVADTRRAERVRNPKRALNRLFREYVGRPYNDRVHAAQIVQELLDLNNIRRCSTFARFEAKIKECYRDSPEVQ